ncbi:hypothetical protein [Paraburkholderia lycopersici]|nr:hypothetical protein [Paraburkholderia lycopersici]
MQRVIGMSIVGASRLKKQIHLRHRLMKDAHVLRLPAYLVSRILIGTRNPLARPKVVRSPRILQTIA